MPDFRALTAAILTAVLVSIFVVCGPKARENGVSLEELVNHADDTNVCVENRNTLVVTVRIHDAEWGQEYGRISNVSPFATRCDWVGIPANRVVNGLISSARRQIYMPPGFENLMTGQKGGAISLVVGQDGVTPFSHSYRAW